MHETQGGKAAHYVRRLIHLSMFIAPFIYYYFLKPQFSLRNLHIFLVGFIFLILVFEYLRIRKNAVFFGQRTHEAKHFSAFGWTMVSLALIFLCQPTPKFALPIIASCAVADPLMGELRLNGVNAWTAFLAGLIVVLMIWFGFASYFHFSFWYLLLAPIIVAVEKPSFHWIDDNALMMLVPLVVVILSRIVLY